MKNQQKFIESYQKSYQDSKDMRQNPQRLKKIFEEQRHEIGQNESDDFEI